MSAAPPTLDDLQRLPLRAVIAYAARTARRLSTKLRATVSADLIERAIREAENVATSSCSLNEVDQVAIARAVQSVTEEYASAPDDLRSGRQLQVMFSIVQTCMAAINAVDAAKNAEKASYFGRRTISAAFRAVRNVSALDDGAEGLVESARRDFEILLSRYGAHKESTFGEPVDCFLEG